MTDQAISSGESRPSFQPRAEFGGRGGEFLRMMFKGALLQLVTLGFYRFWFLTNIRRRLWADTSVMGDAFEYTGRGKELLLGFLFAMAILGPFYILYFILGLEVERLKAFLSLPLFLVFYLFGQFAIFRARRYRLTRTVWRGLRFWMTGSGVAYAIRSFAWLLLVILTLGALYPWREASLERYKMRNTFYGDLQGRFVGKGWSLFKAGAWIWLICLIAVLGPWLYFGVEVTIAKITHADDPLAAQKAGARLGLVALLGMFTPLVGLALWPIFQAIEWKWWLEGLRFGEVSFRSDLRRSRLVGIYLGLFGVILGMMVGFGILGGVGAYAFKDQLKAFATSIAVGPMVYFVVLYLAFLVLFGAFYRYFLQFRVWKTVVKSVAIRNLDDVDDVQARGVAVNALGEGLVDGLDVAGF